MDWDSFFNNLASFLLNISDREGRSCSNIAESVLVHIQCYMRVLYAIKFTLEEANGGDSELLDIFRGVSELIDEIEVIYEHWLCIEAGVESCNVGYCAQRLRYGVGRPRVVIEKEKIEFLRELRFTWTQIASIFGVCRRTLYTIRSENGMLENDEPFSRVSDEELCEHIQLIKQDMPDIGYNMIRGVLRSRSIHVSIPRIQQALHDVDPINTALRWASPVSRRVYGVPHPNFIWHLDGNHKLVR